MATYFRIEKFGVGPYLAREDGGFIYSAHNAINAIHKRLYGENCPRHTPVPPNNWRIASHHIFCFNSISQLRAWFCDEVIFELDARGFELVAMEAPGPEFEDEFQCVILCDAVRVKNGPLLEMLLELI